MSLISSYDQGVFSGIIGNENFRTQFGNPNTGLEGIIVSIYNLGCFTGCIFAFLFCERTGRRLAMWIAMGFIIVSLFDAIPRCQKGVSRRATKASVRLPG